MEETGEVVIADGELEAGIKRAVLLVGECLIMNNIHPMIGTSALATILCEAFSRLPEEKFDKLITLMRSTRDTYKELNNDR